MRTVIVSVALLGLLWGMSGCAGQSEAVPISLRLKPAAEKTTESRASAVRVLVTPFLDDRPVQGKFGMHKALWGPNQPLVSKSGPVGEAIAKQFAEYLVRQGWQAQYVPAGGKLDGHVVISGKVLEGAVDAQGSFGSTEIIGRNKIVVHAKNSFDSSSITDTIGHTGTYSVFWFSPNDAEEILSEVMEKNFEKFVDQTRFDGSVLKFR